MEDFLELARDNTKNDLETCGILGAFLVRFMLILILIPYRIKCHLLYCKVPRLRFVRMR